MNPRRIRFLLFYAAAAAAIAVLMGGSTWLSCYRLANGGISTQALVTNTTCADHATFSYRFAVGGQSFAGSGRDGYGNPSCSALQPGNQVQVVYLAAAPQINIPGDPKARLGDETVAIALAALFLPLLAAFVIFLLLRRRQQ
jgi:hypothetical protein